MRKLLNRGILGVLLSFVLCVALSAQTVNSPSTVTWSFGLGTTGQTATYTTGTEGYFSTNWVALGSNQNYKDKATTNAIVYTRFFPTVQNNSVTANDFVSFNIRPKTGLTFKPTSISFNCIRYGTDGGLIDVSWKSTDGTMTTIATGLKPVRDNAGVTITPVLTTCDLSALTIPASSGECGLYISIYSLGNTKTAGLANIVVNGIVEGTPINVVTHTIATSVFPVGAGSIASNPIGNILDEGTQITFTASRNFGFKFKEWRDATTDALLSSTNPYSLTLSSDVAVKAVYDSIKTYSLAVNGQGAPSYMVAVSPAGTIVGGQTMYETGTTVTLTASNNQVLTFTNWLTGETNPTLVVPMTQNQNITAVYSAADYIVGWDFYRSGGSSRPADLFTSSDNQTATLILRKADGTINSWLDKSIAAVGGTRGSGINWKPLADQYYFQIGFNAKDYTDINVSAGLQYSYNAYSVQKCEYSIDGTNFTTLGTYTMSAGSTWYDQTFTLPADANHATLVYIRWIPDYTSALVGTTALANDGTTISNIYVTAKTVVVPDGVAPVLSSSIPAVNSTTASATGKVVLTFDEKVQVAVGTVASLGGKTITPVVSGKTITFPYSGLDYNTAYTFSLPANSVSDLGGTALVTAISINFTTMTRPTVTKKAFDFVVGVDGDLKAALQAATAVTASGERFRIFFPNGQYNIGANTGDTNQKTNITLPNISFIGQSSDNVVLYNQNTTEGIGTTATVNFTSTANNLYLQDLTLKNKDYRSGVASMGRCVALQDQGTKNIYKNVNVLSNQDTYYSGSGRLYFEGGSLHGTVDFLCGGGDVFFNECLLYLEDRGGNCITAPSTASNWGYVFSGCTIDGFASTNGNYNLGRPWQNSPKSIYINTKMNVLASAAGWTEMGVVPGLFAEYNSTTSLGAVIDLSTRKKSFTYSGVTTPVNPILTADQAATYTIENVLGGTDTWQPKLYTDQANVPAISASGATLSWADNSYVLCWAVFKDGVFVKFVTTNSYAISTPGTYTVRAANEMGGLSAVSNEYIAVATGINNNEANSTIVSQTYFTVEGKKISKIEGFKGLVIVRSIYSDGHIETSKSMKFSY